MTSPFHLRILLVLVVVGGVCLAAAQTQKPPGSLKIEKVRDNLWMISGEGGNVAVYGIEKVHELGGSATGKRATANSKRIGVGPRSGR